MRAGCGWCRAAAFADDPLRTLRLARLACELGFAIDAGDGEVARAQRRRRLRDVAPERIFAELKRIVCSERALDGLELMDALGVTEVVLPELAGAARGRAEPVPPPRRLRPHARGAGRDDRAQRGILRRRSRTSYAGASRAVLDEPLANELTRGQALRFGALFHDIAKPRTRDVTAEGRVTFMGHDARRRRDGRRGRSIGCARASGCASTSRR